MEYYIRVFKKYADFNGRASRLEYWNFVLFNFIVTLIVGIVDIRVGSCGLLSLLYQFVVLLPALAVNCRRLHDTGRNGWSMLITLIPIGGLIAYLVFTCSDGEPDENKYGTAPTDWCLNSFIDGWSSKWICVCGGLLAAFTALLFNARFLEQPQSGDLPFLVKLILMVVLLGACDFFAGLVGAFLGSILSLVFDCSEKQTRVWRIVLFVVCSIPLGVFIICGAFK